ncbi:hypothetical protein KCU78_g17672, partial [Aureobasidium melanogenum]
AGIPTWSPTVVLICRSTAYVWQSGRDAQFSADCGRMCLFLYLVTLYCYYRGYDQKLQITRLKRFAAENGRAGVDVAVPARLLYRCENSAELSTLHEPLELNPHTATATEWLVTIDADEY